MDMDVKMRSVTHSECGYMNEEKSFGGFSEESSGYLRTTFWWKRFALSS
jgi:hypothetical protein